MKQSADTFSGRILVLKCLSGCCMPSSLCSSESLYSTINGNPVRYCDAFFQDIRISLEQLKQSFFTLFTGCCWRPLRTAAMTDLEETEAPVGEGAVAPLSIRLKTRDHQDIPGPVPRMTRRKITEGSSSRTPWPQWSSLCFFLLPLSTG